MAVSKVILNGTTLMDVTVDTVTSEKLLTGYQATGRDGEKVQGGYVPSTASFTTGSADPSESAQHILPPSGYDGFSYFDVGAVSSDYVGSNVTRNSAADLSASGSVVSVPSGYYAAAASTAIAMASASSVSINAAPAITVSTTGLIQAFSIKTGTYNPITTAGYADSSTTIPISVTISNTSQLSTQSAATITPTESSQTAVAAGKYTTGAVTVAAVSSDYVGSNVAQNTAGDLTASGSVVTVPSGYYASSATTAIDRGTYKSNYSIAVTPGITVNSSGMIQSYINTTNISVPVDSFGYFDNIKGLQTIVAGSSTYQLSTASASTYTPSSTTQTIPSGVYLTGVQTIEPIPIAVDNHRLIVPEGYIGV